MFRHRVYFFQEEIDGAEMKTAAKGYMYALISALNFCTALVCFEVGWRLGGCIWLLSSGIWFAGSRLAFRMHDV